MPASEIRSTETLQLQQEVDRLRQIERQMRITIAQDRKRNIQLEGEARARQREIEQLRRELEQMRVQVEGGSVLSSISRIFNLWVKRADTQPPARECPVQLV